MICQETLEQKLSVVKQRFRNYRNVQGVLAISSRTKYGIAEFSEKLVRVAKERFHFLFLFSFPFLSFPFLFFPFLSFVLFCFAKFSSSGTVSRKVPRSYFLLERQISLLKEKRPTLSWNEFLEVSFQKIVLSLFPCPFSLPLDHQRLCHYLRSRSKKSVPLLP